MLNKFPVTWKILTGTVVLIFSPICVSELSTPTAIIFATKISLTSVNKVAEEMKSNTYSLSFSLSLSVCVCVCRQDF